MTQFQISTLFENVTTSSLLHLGIKDKDVNKKNLLFLGALVLLLGTKISAQQSLEIGGMYGVSNYLGDLQQSNFELATTHNAGGLFTRLNLGNSFSIKAHHYQGKISGSDANYVGSRQRQRNLHFQSKIVETGLQFELALMTFGQGNGRKRRRQAAPFLFAGISHFSFNPQTDYQGEWVDLQPLGTEGQGYAAISQQEKYKLQQWSIPLGIGFNFRIKKRFNAGFELGFRKTFTDYLDDISGTYPDLDQLRAVNPMAADLSFRTPEYLEDTVPVPDDRLRGDFNKTDFYFFGGITVSYYLKEWQPMSKKLNKNQRLSMR